MNYLDFVALIVPALIGLVAALALGPNRGVLLGGAAMLAAVFILLLFQITIPRSGPDGEISRISYAWELIQFEWYRWLPSFLIGAGAGSIAYGARSGRPARRARASGR